MFNKSVIIVIVIVIVPLSLPPPPPAPDFEKMFFISHERPFLNVLRRKAKKWAFLKIDPCIGINFGYLRTPPQILQSVSLLLKAQVAITPLILSLNSSLLIRFVRCLFLI